MQQLKNDIIQYAIDRLGDGIGIGAIGADLHNDLFNTDYYHIYYHEAEKWLGEHTWEAIGKVQEFDEEHFGEVRLNLSDSCNVANMLAYILGEELLSECEYLQSHWDNVLNDTDINAIKTELEKML